jgi:hypothetical protein
MSVYYPYIHIRDERWLKVAALYWPRMVRIVSPDYPTRDSQLVEILRDELGFILDLPPDAAARDAAEPFAAFTDGFGPTALERLRVGQESVSLGPEQLAVPHPPAAFGAVGDIADETCVPAFEHYSPRWSAHGIGANTAGVHRSEVAAPLADKLIDLGLAVPARGEWLAMNPELAWLYKCRLTEEMARRNNLVPATDQMPAHAVMDGPVDVGSLLGQAGRPLKSADFQAGFGLLSINAVTGPADDIRRGLADVGVDAALTAINTKFAVPAAAIAGLAAPPIAAAGGIALAATNLRQSTRRLARAQQAAPAAYLLNVCEALTPQTLVTQILAVMRRASGLRS